MNEQKSAADRREPAPRSSDQTDPKVVSLHTPKTEQKRLDKELDKALADSFPASDPPSASQPTGTEPAGDPRVRP